MQKIEALEEITAARQRRLAMFVADVSARLRQACAHLPDAEFSALARDIARMHLRFEELEDRPGGDAVLRSPLERARPPWQS